MFKMEIVQKKGTSCRRLSQTKILEGGTKDEIRIFEELFKGVSTRFGLRTIEKSVENPDFIFCSPFQNLRLGSIKCQPGFVVNIFVEMFNMEIVENKGTSCRRLFSKHFSTIRSPNRVLTPLKSASPGNAFGKVGSASLPQSSFGRGKIASKTHSETLVHPSQNFVWGT